MVVDLPDAEKLAAVLKAARDQGVTHLRLGSLDVSFGPFTQADLVAMVNRDAPLPATDSPLANARRQTNEATRERPDALEELANGSRLVEPIENDPTRVS